MYSQPLRERALALLGSGLSVNQTSKVLGVSRAAISQWRDRGIEPCQEVSACPRCDVTVTLEPTSYALLFGYYLGDGCVSTYRGKNVLRVTCDVLYPGLIEEVTAAIRQVRPEHRVFHVPAEGCVQVQSNWKHWPCLFPQHGPGRRHERQLVLEPWQQEIVDTHPVEFLRGLFHSDGCRFTNWTTRNNKRYEYGRWMFSNHSPDIMLWCQQALDRLGVTWTMPRWDCLSVATKLGVAYLDEVIGAKS